MEFINDRDFKMNKTCITLGKFDGLHKGHMLLINKAVSYSRENNLNSVLFTFDLPRKSIYSTDFKVELIRELGIDVCIMYPFDKETTSMEPEIFIEQVLVKAMDVKMIIVGKDFCFGHNRRGNVEMLLNYSHKYGYKVKVVEKLAIKDDIVSSTLVREYLEKGDIQLVNEFLGRKYSLEGVVTYGRQLGRTIGFPTANIKPDENVIMPRYGVYKTTVHIDGQIKNGITNIGCRPTVNGHHVSIETFINDFNSDIYGHNIKLEFEDFIRPEMKFSGVDELKEQIKKDIESITLY